jgi:hypothetical protein
MTMNTFWGLLLHWFLMVSAIIYIITRSSIASPLRVMTGMALERWPVVRGFVRMLIYCAACSGFWIGAAFARDWPFEGPWWSRIAGSALAALTIGSVWSNYWPPIYEYEATAWGVTPPEEDDAAPQEETENDD